MVIDNFYPDPDLIRDMALKRKFFWQKDVNYPGMVANPPTNWSDNILTISRLLNHSMVGRPGSGQGFFRLGLQSFPPGKSLAHTDPSHISVVIYLSKTDQDGTFFLRHKEKGFDRITPSNASVTEKCLKRDTNKWDAWEVLSHVEHKYNRLVMFDGRYVHSGPRKYYGKAKKDGRLTQHYFLEFHRAGGR